MHAQGVSAAKIAAEIGTSYESVHRWLHEPNHKKHIPFGQEIRERAQELRAQGVTTHEIAAQLGVTTMTLYRWSKESPPPCPQPQYETLAKALITMLARFETDPTRQQLLTVLAGLYK